MQRVLVGLAVGSVYLLSNVAHAQGETSAPPAAPAETTATGEAAPAEGAPAEGWGPMNAITTGPAGLLLGIIGVGSINIEYERALSSGMSFYAAPNMIFGGTGVSASAGGTTSSVRTDLFGFGAGLGMRFYPMATESRGAPRGFWVGPGASFGLITSTTTSTAGTTSVTGSVSLFTVSAGAQLGYTWLIGDVFALSLGGGGGLTLLNSATASTGSASATGTGGIGFDLGYLARFNLGYAF